MIPAPFDYEVAESVGHALSLLGEREDAKLLAGGHSLLPVLRLRFARPSLLVDVGRLEELSYIRDTGDALAIGAVTRPHDVATSPAGPGPNPLPPDAPGPLGDPPVGPRGPHAASPADR